MRCFLFIFFYIAVSPCFSQDNFKISIDELKQYEGRYEYSGHQTLDMAASPKNLILYAIIDDARYPLRPAKKDVFLNNGNQEVRFIRNATQEIVGYSVADENPDRVFKLINKNVSFPEKMWFPRIDTITKYKYAQPQNRQDGLQTGSLIGTGLDQIALEKMVDDIGRGHLPNVHSVLIIKDGKLVFEEYFYEYDVNTLQQIRSATKSFISALVGIAIDKGMIKSKDEPVLSFFPEFSVNNLTDDKKKITIENMLNNQSGLDCNDHDGKSPGNEVKMYPTANWVKFILDLPMIDKPGHEARYCSGNVMTLASIVERASRQPLYEFAKKNLFDPLQAAGYKWNFKPDSSEMNTFGQLYIKPRDMAKFGLLFLNNGKCGSREVISENWVKESLVPHTSIENTPYGYLWWHPWLMVNGSRQDATAAKGNGGQRIYLRPDLNMVVVITGGNYNSESSADQLLVRYILPPFSKK